MSDLITIILTQGDPAGIGPEIVVRASREWRRPEDCRLIPLGYPRHFESVRSHAQSAPVVFGELDQVLTQSRGPGVYWAIAAPEELDQPVKPGIGSETGARAAIRCIELAIDAARAGRADAICTAPINKENMKLAGFAYPGHTEMLAGRSGAKQAAMMLVGGGLRVVLATIHEPLAKVPQLLSRAKLADLMTLIHDSLSQWGIENPRIGVAGLNPHAGEGGMFGREEIEIIAPAIADARAAGINASGPFSADTIFHRMLTGSKIEDRQRSGSLGFSQSPISPFSRDGEFDVILAMYHDQGLIPIKTLDFHGGVNVTLGLPFVRTSPDHGTAYDIAGKGIADIGSMTAALDAAYRMAKSRKEAKSFSKV
ncbi:4-hydroxythreonine-4-phosphate dehydrogenase PdxA [Candidatus Sumerlaeota bacterium]|nr:4-hydroxythreonine-4-phosphate dehydrogenase PdxA [Candidatus Sumerlaeota bacterium]